MTGLSFVCCVNQPEVARRRLLASPCLGEGRGHQLILAAGMRSAGQGYAWGRALARHGWIVLVHQDVFLPEGWDDGLCGALADAERLHPNLAVAGVYGVCADGSHAGHVYDRDRWIGAPLAGAQRVRSLDELLLVVRADAGLAVAPELGWHLYGTDLCLQAEAAGLAAVVVPGPCEHHSSLPRMLGAPRSAGERHALQSRIDDFNASAGALCRRWPDALPVATTIATIADARPLSLNPP